jgi:hypothetical protein
MTAFQALCTHDGISQPSKFQVPHSLPSLLGLRNICSASFNAPCQPMHGFCFCKMHSTTTVHPNERFEWRTRNCQQHSNAQREQQRNCPLPLRLVGGRLKVHFVFSSPSSIRRRQHSIDAAFPLEAGEHHSPTSLSLYDCDNHIS